MYDLPKYEFVLDDIECDDYDLLFGPEIAINKSELLFKNYYNDESLLKSEEQINYFWSGQCTDSKGMWFYNNYPEILLRSCRLALWNGGKIKTMTAIPLK